MAEGSFVTYYRVSTSQQGRSGLGLEAQKESVARYLDGGDWNLIGEFVEVESGKKKNRPELAAALQACKQEKATLLIAKLDRLARNVAFIANLMESGVDFVAVDMPTADRFMLHVYAAMAEEEGRRISQRTKDALAAAKARGVELGKNGKVLARQNQEKAATFAKGMAKTVQRLRNEGFTTVRQLADELNRRGVPSANGARWHVPTVHRLLRRMDQNAA